MNLRPITLVALRAHRMRQTEQRPSACPLWRNGGFIFTSDVGGSLDQGNLQDQFDRAFERAGIKRRMIKETRHTFATLGLTERVPVKINSAALGHVSCAVTQDIYSHVAIGLQQDSMSHLDRLFT